MTAATAAAPSTSVVEDPPFKKTEPMAYAIGDIGNGFYFQLVTNYALIYMTDALGINPVIAGMIIFVGKLISAFTDFGTGVWADNAPLRKDGRYHWFVRTLRYPLMAVINPHLPAVRLQLADDAAHRIHHRDLHPRRRLLLLDIRPVRIVRLGVDA